jgi:DNA-binding NtrC family response regulator
MKELHPLAIKRISQYTWPGNIRELENTIERAVLMANGGMIKAEDLGLTNAEEDIVIKNDSPDLPSKGIDLEEVEKELIIQALMMCEWIQKDAAALLGISNRVLNYKIKKHGITHPGWKRFK